MTGNEKSYWKNESYKAYCPNIILSHDLTIGEAGYEKCDPGHKWGPGSRNFWTFHYVESGRGILNINGKRFCIGKDDFFEIYVNTPLEICEERDVKGLYKKARQGEIKNFTGISAPFEAPLNPAITIDTSACSLEESVNLLKKIIIPQIKPI